MLPLPPRGRRTGNEPQMRPVEPPPWPMHGGQGNHPLCNAP